MLGYTQSLKISYNDESNHSMSNVNYPLSVNPSNKCGNINMFSILNEDRSLSDVVSDCVRAESLQTSNIHKCNEFWT